MKRKIIEEPRQKYPLKKYDVSPEGHLCPRKSEHKHYWVKWSHHALWDLAFRPWFLLASATSIASIFVWLLYLNGLQTPLNNHSLSPLIFHIHEMLFGFAITVALGFLLTAVQTWTGMRSTHGIVLIALTSIWLASRFLLWLGPNDTQWYLIPLQGLWWLLCIFIFSRLVIRARNRRNYIFIPLLCMMMIFHLTILSSALIGNDALAIHLSRTMVLLVGILISLVGGRVIPFFTQRGAPKANIVSTPTLDRLLPIASIAGALVFFIGFFISMPLSPATLMIASGLLHGARLSYWDSFATKKIPLLWSLHLAYLLLSIGLIMLGSSYFFDIIYFSNALHLITIGSIGGMILAMMSRVSLGHTGRALSPPFIISLAFFIVFLSALIRSLMPLLQPLATWNSSGILWIIAFSLFLFCYTPILFKQKIS
ncbi:MAG: NnrS family protein [Cellvibrionaceae bacterium]